MRRLRSLIGLVVMLAGGCAERAPSEDPFTASGEVIAMGGGDGGAGNACFTCHGLAGQGDGGPTPRLAGLDPGYLHRQLDDYASGRRDHPAMRAVARRLQSDARAKVSAYYSGLPSEARTGSASGNAVGRHLYEEGDPARGLPPCAVCHGAVGEGVGRGNPPLAGQSAIFIAAQLDAWREGRRYNDPLGEMREISRRLRPHEIAPVARHAARLRGTRPPAVPAASR